MTVEKVDRDHQLRAARTEDGGHLGAIGLRSLCKRRKRRQTGAAPDRDDMAKFRVEREADPERTHDVDGVACAKRGEATRARARDLVKKLRLETRGINAI